MYKFKNSLVGLIGLLILVGIATSVLPRNGRGASRASSSAPISQTQNVNVVNTPTVTAQQSGTWNVGINGTPTVAVSNFPATSSVSISGTPTVGLDFANNTVKFDAVNNTVKIDTTNPLPVRDVDNPARHPFQASIDTTWPAGFIAKGTTLFTVPSGKRAVVEYVTMFLIPTAGQKVQFAQLSTTVGGNAASFDFVGTPIASVGLINQSVRLYADPVTNIVSVAGLDASSSGLGGQITVTISGYLVDVP